MSARAGSVDYDLAIIGGGSGGYAAARTASRAGLRTVVIEGAQEIGGLCILRGCMPTKALLFAAEVMHRASHAEPWGITSDQITFDFPKVMARKDRLVQEFADYRREQLATGKFKFIRATAHFLDPHTIQLSSGERLKAAHFIIATGSKIAPSPLPSLASLACLDSDSALKLEKLPESLIMLGGGAVAVEFAQFFARFGVRVTLIQRSPHILHEFDSDAAEALEIAFRREGVTLYTGTQLVEGKKGPEGKEIVFKKGNRLLNVQAEQVFFALGRVPNIEALRLERIGIQVEYNRIVTDLEMRTSIPHIYAAGDCTGLHEIVHIAVLQGEVAAHNIARRDRTKKMDYRLLTEVIFTEPQIASVGLTEKRADVKGIRYVAASYPFKDHGKSMIMEATDGFVKLLADPMSGEIIGGCCVGPMAGELIHEIIVAMDRRLTVHELAATPHYHPTLSEIWTYPAEELAEQIDLARSAK